MAVGDGQRENVSYVLHCCDVADAAQNTTQGIEQLTVTWHVQAVDVRVNKISFVGLRAT